MCPAGGWPTGGSAPRWCSRSTSTPYPRSPSRYPPNNLYVTGDALRGAVDQAGLPSYWLQRGPIPITGGAAGTTADVPDERSSYRFDGATGTYTKAVDGRTLSDA